MSTRYRVVDLPDIDSIPLSGGPTALFGVYTVFGYGHLARCHRWRRRSRRAHRSTRTSSPAIQPSGWARIPHTPSRSTCRVRCSWTRGAAGRPAGSRRRSRKRARDVDRGAVGSQEPAAPGTGAAPRADGGGRRPLPLLDIHGPRRRRVRGDPPTSARHNAGHPPLRGLSRPVTTRKDASDQADCRRLIEQCLDLVLVYVDPREREDFFDRHPFLRPIEARVRFVGYVAPPRGRWSPRDPTVTRILATFGAGIDRYPSIRLACEAFRILAATRSASGARGGDGRRLARPSSAGAREGLYPNSDRLNVVRSLPALWKHLGEYGLVISMGGTTRVPSSIDRTRAASSCRGCLHVERSRWSTRASSRPTGASTTWWSPGRRRLRPSPDSWPPPSQHPRRLESRSTWEAPPRRPNCFTPSSSDAAFRPWNALCERAGG